MRVSICLPHCVEPAHPYAVACAEASIDQLAATGEHDGYHLLHAARADLLRRLGLLTDAAASMSAPSHL